MYTSQISFSKYVWIRDETDVLLYVQNNPSCFEYLDENLQNKKEFLELNISKNDYKEENDAFWEKIAEIPLKFLSKKLQEDKKFVLKALSKNLYQFKDLKEELRYDKSIVMHYISLGYDFYQYTGIPQELIDDQDVMQALMNSKSYTMMLQSKKLAYDKEFILRMIKKHPSIYKYLPKEIESDLDVFLMAIRSDSKYLWNIKYTKFANDRDFFLNHLQEFPQLSSHFSNEMKNDKDFVVQNIVRNKHFILGDKLQKDKEFVLMLIKEHKLPAYMINMDLKSDKEIAFSLLKNDNSIMRSLPKNIRDEKEIIEYLIEINGHNLYFASKRLKKDRELVLKAIEKSPHSLFDADKRLKKDPEIVLKALQKSEKTWKYVSDILRNDIDFILEASKYVFLEYIPDTILLYKEYMIKLVGVRPSYVSMRPCLGKDVDIMTVAIEKDGLTIKYASDEVLKDRSLVIKAIKNNPKAYSLLPLDLQNEKLIYLTFTKIYNFDVNGLLNIYEMSFFFN